VCSGGKDFRCQREIIVVTSWRWRYECVLKGVKSQKPVRKRVVRLGRPRGKRSRSGAAVIGG
jgi:hypothetical protein